MPPGLNLQITIDTNFEEGSAHVVELDQSAISVRIMAGRDSERGWPGWLCFRARVRQSECGVVDQHADVVAMAGHSLLDGPSNLAASVRKQRPL